MSVEAPSQAQLRREIWMSFVSVLQSYAALASLSNAAGIAVTQAGEGEVLLKSRQAALHLFFSPDDGLGRWLFSAGSDVLKNGEFELPSDGTLSRDGMALELDIAAIEWIEMLVAFEQKAEGEKDK